MIDDGRLTVTDIAEAAGVSRVTVHSWIRRGLLPATIMRKGMKKHYEIRESDYRQFERRYLK